MWHTTENRGERYRRHTQLFRRNKNPLTTTLKNTIIRGTLNKGTVKWSCYANIDKHTNLKSWNYNYDRDFSFLKFIKDVNNFSHDFI